MENLQALRRALQGLIEKASVTPTEDGFEVKDKMVGESARELNRTLSPPCVRWKRKPGCERSGYSGKASSGSLTLCPKACIKGSDRTAALRNTEGWLWN